MFSRRFKQSLQSVDSMLGLLGGHFLKSKACRGGCPESLCLLVSIDSAESLEAGTSPLALRIKIFFTNVVELVVSIFRRRQAVYRSIYLTEKPFGESIAINFRNGTATVIGEKSVTKFYFKDILFFSSLYKVIGPLLKAKGQLSREFFALEQPRHIRIHGKPETKSLSFQVCKILEDHDLCLSRAWVTPEACFPVHKIMQLARFYNVEGNRNLSGYLEISKELTEKAKDFKNGYCHGDVWTENIMKNVDGALALIDFDKTVWFCKSYDYAYLYLMYERRSSPKMVLENLGQLSCDVEQFLNEEFEFTLGKCTVRETRLDLLLFALLKLAEKDFRNCDCGASLSVLLAALEGIPEVPSCGFLDPQKGVLKR